MANIPYSTKEPQVSDWRAGSPYYYTDRLTVWLSQPLTPGELRRLRNLCDYVHIFDGDMPRNPKWRQRLQLVRPSLECLLRLQRIEAGQGILINYVELARDEVCQSPEALRSLYALRRTHEIRLWHPKTQKGYVFAGEAGTTYDASRRKHRQLVRYKEPYCRITGELDCLHSEFRLRGTASVRRAGIHCIRDLINFNHEQWWRTKTKLVAVDLERLGKRYHNTMNRTKLKRSRVVVSRCGRFRFNLDRRLGTILWVTVGRCRNTMQGLLDLFRGTRLLEPALVQFKWE